MLRLLVLASTFGIGYKFFCCLLDAVGSHGSDLLLKLFYPLGNIIIVSLALRLSYTLIIASTVRLDLILLLVRRVRANRTIQVRVLHILAVACRTSMLGSLFADLLKHLL